MRLGLSSALAHETPEEWAEKLSAIGCKAVNFPVDYTAKDEIIDRYVKAACEHDLVIAEVGAWCNPISLEKNTREAALVRCKEQLRLADRLHANCCVNVSGSRGERWDGHYRGNFTEEAWEATVQSIQEIIDEVKPVHTCYTIEPMPWMYPMGPDEYVKLLQDVDREAFAVHMDVFNWITSAKRYFYHEEFMEECFNKLGNFIKSCHLKNVLLEEEFTLRLTETACEKGGLNLVKYAELIDAVNPELPVILEHLDSQEEYLRSLSWVQELFLNSGIQI